MTTITFKTATVLVNTTPRSAVLATRGADIRAVYVSEYGPHVAQVVRNNMCEATARHGNYTADFEAAPRVQKHRAKSGRQWLMVAA
jgi:hypothetical protein